MTYPRAHLVDPNGGYYHVNSRCVRRAWLCGADDNGRNYDHRRQWLEDRILQLAEIFAVDLCGYAVNPLEIAVFSITNEYWLGLYLSQPKRWQRAIGSVQSLKDYAKEIGQCWIKTWSPQLRF